VEKGSLDRAIPQRLAMYGASPAGTERDRQLPCPTICPARELARSQVMLEQTCHGITAGYAV